jgi:biopolymer transport protein ExbB
MQFSPIEIWSHMGLPALLIAAILLLMGLASLTVFTERLITLRLSHEASRRFAESIVRDMEAGNIEAVITRAAEPSYSRGHLTRMIQRGLTAYRHLRSTADIGGLPAAERARRDIDRFMEEISADLRRGMAVLSSVGSTAPFVGLLGTVVGIISAFQGIAATGSGGLAAVSAGISEALVETALGLAIAIPAVLAFNYLSEKVAREELALSHGAGELLDTIDDWEERRTRNTTTRETIEDSLDRGPRHSTAQA